MSTTAGADERDDVIEEVERKPLSKAAWSKAAYHTVLCPSGAVIEIKIPDLPALIEAGSVPQHLLDAALGSVGMEDQKPTVDDIVKQREFTDLLVSFTASNPKVSYEEAASVPFEDKEFIVAIATRQRDLDAEGEHIAGLTKSTKFRRFRKLGEFDETLEGL